MCAANDIGASRVAALSVNAKCIESGPIRSKLSGSGHAGYPGSTDVRIAMTCLPVPIGGQPGLAESHDAPVKVDVSPVLEPVSGVSGASSAPGLTSAAVPRNGAAPAGSGVCAPSPASDPNASNSEGVFASKLLAWGRLAAIFLVGITALLLAAGTLMMLRSLLPLNPHDGFNFRRHWGGFGGGATGWYVSPPLVQLAVAISLAALAALLALQLLDTSREQSGKGAPADTATASRNAAATHPRE